jgi:hypothetical protein
MPTSERSRTWNDRGLADRPSAPLLLLDPHQPSQLTACRNGRRVRFLASVRSSSLDRQLSEGRAPEESRLLAARAHQLVAAPMRRAVAEGWRTLVDRSLTSPVMRSSRVALPRRSIAACEPEITEMVEALTRPAPSSARGVATASWLLSDGTGPLYQCRQPDALRVVLRRAIAWLDPSTPL